MTGGVDLPDASSRLLRGVSEGRKVGSLLTAVSGSPAEGGEVAGGEASGLAGGVEGELSASVLSLVNGYASMAEGRISLSASVLDTVSGFRPDLRGHFAAGGELLVGVP